ncbi:hypothetical protein J7400_20830 [Shimia sp. R9_2]|uniref:DUF7678 domain-containing protein n=1 Tax=Shimia sp. R9_2 TaxID=2821112 RepID=UPI001ADAC67B|nr:hypothetical protein [Shimia sp. R9_2]MBO9399128.1 hypothetical protein [Shimia sp. R9_2]
MTDKRFKLGTSDTAKLRAQQSTSETITLENNDINYGGWTKGRLKSQPEYSFSAKVFQQPSRFGIDGGLISKLEVRKNGERIASFDRGWDIEPQNHCDQEALKEIRQGLGEEKRDRASISQDLRESRGR